MEPIPTAIVAAANDKSRKLRELVRAPEILIMPGAYDVSERAALSSKLGFQAIQGTSGGIAAALGYPDGEVMSQRFVHRAQRQLRRCGARALQCRRRKRLRR